jgi:ribosome maturation factor RimP
MANEEKLHPITQMMEGLLQEDPSVFLVDIRIKPTNNIKVFLDADAGISIERCVFFNRKLYKLIEEAALFPEGDFSLEVSSPGLDEPLKLRRQYQKNIGRQVEVTFNDGTKLEGKLLAVNENDLLLEETKGKNKKKEQVIHALAFDNIKTTKIQVVF